MVMMVVVGGCGVWEVVTKAVLALLVTVLASGRGRGG